MTSISAAPPPPPPPPVQNVQTSAAVQRESAVREGDRVQQALDPKQDAASVSVTPEARELAAQQAQPAEQSRQEVQPQPQVAQTAPSNQSSPANLRQQLVG